MDIALPVGYIHSQPLPLGRFLPPVDEGVITQVLKRYVPKEGLVFDPFGASPMIALEAARAGYPVVVAANNPINRFILRKTLQPFSQGILQAALAQLAAIPKNGSRMEMVLLDLYRSECNRCGQIVSVEYFVWDKELGGPTHKVYTCGHCAFTGEAAATEEDWNRAADYSRKGLQHAIAMEQVAPSGDPDRQHAEAALGTYPGRAIYALVTLLNKVDQGVFEEPILEAIRALLLSAFDAGNSMWSYPEGRSRPRQLIASARFRENNLWRALEKAVDVWAMGSDEIKVVDWQGRESIIPGQVVIAASSAREVSELIGKGQIAALVSVPPRPNQAYWSLTALWTAWLWKREAASSIKVALRRRRYDWAWHAGALRTVLGGITSSLDRGTPAVIYIPEAEPGFLEAAFVGFDASGFELKGRAYRAAEEQAFLHWSYPGREPPAWDAQRGRDLLRQAVGESLAVIGEPVPFAIVHASAWSQLSEARMIASAMRSKQRQPMQIVDEWLESELNNRLLWEHLTRGIEFESGSYWFAQPTPTDDPLFDRVERMILGLLRTVDAIGEVELDMRVCEAFPGIATPDRRLIMACLNSYGQPRGDGLWTLRPEDYAEARLADCQEVFHLLCQLGESLGYSVSRTEPLYWFRPDGTSAYTFRVSEMASWGWERMDFDERTLTMVIPGGRAVLLAEKARRDLRVRTWMQTPGRVLKFRHVRRLVTEPDLTAEGFAERIAIDPPEHQDPQMPLL
ncbi:MAG: hypothetical protein E4G99_00305 [Anaerolineales bacterium]|nr:MAG: hypothetical protein E4G99_00305 [Anaerolineales bacterium]